MPDYSGRFYCNRCHSQYETEKEQQECERRHIIPNAFDIKHCYWKYGDKYPYEITVNMDDSKIGTYKLRFIGE